MLKGFLESKGFIYVIVYPTPRFMVDQSFLLVMDVKTRRLKWIPIRYLDKYRHFETLDAAKAAVSDMRMRIC